MTEWQHEFFLRNGASFIINDLIDITVERDENKKLISLNIRGSKSHDKIMFLDISEVICVIKRKKPERKKRWKLWN